MARDTAPGSGRGPFARQPAPAHISSLTLSGPLPVARGAPTAWTRAGPAKVEAAESAEAHSGNKGAFWARPCRASAPRACGGAAAPPRLQKPQPCRAHGRAGEHINPTVEWSRSFLGLRYVIPGLLSQGEPPQPPPVILRNAPAPGRRRRG